MPQVLQINTVINSGSTGRIAEGIGRQAMQKGWESYMAYGRYGNTSQSKVIKIGSKWDNYRNVLKTRLTDRHGLGARQATRAFVQQIKQIQPDIIHLHNIHGYYLNYEILFSFLKNINTPVVWTLHDCWPFTGHCGYYSYAQCEKWKTEKGCHHCPETRSYPMSFVDHSPENFSRKKRAFTSLKNLTLVPVSKWLEGEVKRAFLKEVPCKQIYNGTDIDTFKPLQDRGSSYEKYGIPRNKKVYLGVASIWERRKGLREFLELQKRLKSDEVLVLVGLSAKQIKALPKGVVGIKRTENQSELVKLYNVATAFVNLTLEESFGMTNVEALACGTPVISYQTGGSPETIDKNTGWIVPKGDLKGVKKAMDACQKENQQLRLNCRQRAEKLFDKTKRFQEYVDLYENLLKNN